MKTSEVSSAEKQRDIQHALQQMKPSGRRCVVATLRRSWPSTLIYAVLIVALGGCVPQKRSPNAPNGTEH